MHPSLSARPARIKRTSGFTLACAFTFCALPVFAKPTNAPWEKLQPDQAEVTTSLNMVELLKRHHYSRLPLDDAHSEKIFDGYLRMLDSSHSLFSAKDIERFKPWRTEFDDFLKNGDLKPGFAMYKRYLERQNERLTYILGLLDQGIDKLDFKQDESLLVDRKHADWKPDDAALKDLWRRQLKDQVLRQKIKDKDNASIQKTLVRRYKSLKNNIEQTNSEDVFRTYSNAYAESYDPHTDYMSPDDVENFNLSMSLSLQGIGAVLQADDDYVKIVSLVTGGPAEKSKQLAPADRIVGVAQGKKGEMVDVIGMRLDKVVKLIRGPKGSTVRLEVVPAKNAPNDDSTKVVSIVRDAVKLEDQAAQKSVLNLHENGRDYKLGIITLPAFYLDFNAYRNGDSNYTSSTRDVRRLISELEKEHIDGLVIDLRNNGGGSLQEASELTGLFIPQGPTVQIRNRDRHVELIGSEDSEPYYEGPMAVLVNRLSASASEIFAGAMQDYRRALIIGGQTFGKGTVQNIQPLNQGELKMTLAKFYRVSGQSTQHRGVIPDVMFPAEVNTKEIGESALPEALPWDTINPVITLTEDPIKPVLAELRKKHEQRTAKNPDFVYSRERLDLMDKLTKDTTLSLNEDKRRAYQNNIESEELQLENARRVAKGKKPLKKLKDDDDTATLAKAKEDEQKHPEKDAYLKEAGEILVDYIKANTKVAANQQ